MLRGREVHALSSAPNTTERTPRSVPTRKAPEDEKILTRADLFDLVWKQPMRTLAPQFGVSDVGFAKMCRRLNIPTPPRGYWAKLEHGKKVRKPTLPAAPPQTAETIVVKTEAHTPSPDDNLPGDIAELIETLRQRTIVVPQTSSKVHGTIQRWRSEDDGQKYNLYSRPTRLGPTERRRRRILNSLFQEVERSRGGVKSEDRHKFKLTVAGETLEVTCSERYRQVKIQLTPEEQRKSYYPNKGYRTDHQATGELRLRIEGYYQERLRREWHDLPEKPLEGQLQEVLIGLARAAAIERRKRLEREDRERREHEAEKRRWELERRRSKIDKHLKEILAEADDWVRAAHLRRYANATIQALRDATNDDAADERSWAQWTLSAADCIDPLAEGPTVAELFELLPESAKKDDNPWTNF